MESHIHELDTSQRHPSVQEVCSFFRFDHLANDAMAATSKIFFDTAAKMLATLDDGPMLTHALYDLWRAKNAAVAQCVSDLRAEGQIH